MGLTAGCRLGSCSLLVVLSSVSAASILSTTLFTLS